MKKALIALSMVLLCLGFAHAELSFGVRGGLNLANFKWSQNDLHTSNRVGFHIGALLQYSTPVNLILQPELIYSQKGNIADYLSSEYRFEIDYLEFPFLFKYDIDLQVVNIQPYIGPEFGVAIVAKKKFSGYTEDLKNDINAFNFGIAIGSDLVITKNYFLGLHYHIGLTDVFKSDPIAEEEANGMVTNSDWMVSLGYLF